MNYFYINSEMNELTKKWNFQIIKTPFNNVKDIPNAQSIVVKDIVGLDSNGFSNEEYETEYEAQQEGKKFQESNCPL